MSIGGPNATRPDRPEARWPATDSFLYKKSHLQNHRRMLGNSIPELQPEIEDRCCRPSATTSGGAQRVFGHFRPVGSVLARRHAGKEGGAARVLPLRNEAHQLQHREAQNSE